MSAVGHKIADSAADLTEQNYRFLKEHLYHESGIVLENGKDYLVESRLIPIVKRKRLASLNHLCSALHRDQKDSLNRARVRNQNALAGLNELE